MANQPIDWDAATPEQIDRSLRAWKIRLRISAVQYALVVGIAFWVGSPVLGALTVVVGVVGMSLTWRWVKAKHRQPRRALT